MPTDIRNKIKVPKFKRIKDQLLIEKIGRDTLLKIAQSGLSNVRGRKYDQNKILQVRDHINFHNITEAVGPSLKQELELPIITSISPVQFFTEKTLPEEYSEEGQADFCMPMVVNFNETEQEVPVIQSLLENSKTVSVREFRQKLSEKLLEASIKPLRILNATTNQAYMVCSVEQLTGTEPFVELGPVDKVEQLFNKKQRATQNIGISFRPSKKRTSSRLNFSQEASMKNEGQNG